MASTNTLDVAYVKETVAGTTPNNPAFQRLPITGCALAEQFSTAVSEAIRKDRMVDDLVVVDADVNGTVDYELSFAAYRPMLISLLQASAPISTVNLSMSDAAVAATAKTITTTAGDFVAGGIKVGQLVRLAGFAQAKNNGVFRVTAVVAKTLTLADPQSKLTNETAGANVKITGTCYRNGIGVPDSYTFRKSFNIPGKPAAVFYYRGCQISAMSFQFAQRAILKGGMSVIGMTAEGTTTPVTGESLVDVAEYTVMNSVSSVAALTLEGLPDTAFFSSLNLTVDNGANPQKGIAQLGARGIANFTQNITGSVELYFEDLAVYNIFKAAQAFKMSFVLQDGAGNMLAITLPKCKFESLSQPVSGKDQFLMESATIRALRDATTNCQIQVDFFPAA